jgi:hypothetical protein
VKKALVMERHFTLGWLRALNVKLAGLANNHALDGGEVGLARTADTLTAAGITPVRDGEVIDAGPFRAVALSDLSNASTPHTGRITRGTIARLPKPDADVRPLFAFLHLGHRVPSRGDAQADRTDGLDDGQPDNGDIWRSPAR